MRKNSILRIAAAALMATSMLAGCGVAQKPVSLCEAGKPVAMQILPEYLAGITVDAMKDFSLGTPITIDHVEDAALCRAPVSYKMPVGGALWTVTGYVQYTVKQTPEGPLWVQAYAFEAGPVIKGANDKEIPVNPPNSVCDGDATLAKSLAICKH